MTEPIICHCSHPECSHEVINRQKEATSYEKKKKKKQKQKQQQKQKKKKKKEEEEEGERKKEEKEEEEGDLEEGRRRFLKISKSQNHTCHPGREEGGEYQSWHEECGGGNSKGALQVISE